MQPWKILLLLALCSPAAHAAQVRVQLIPAHDDCRGEAVLVAEPENGKRLTARLGADQQSSVFNIGDGQTWTISAERARCWSPRVAWSPTDGADVVLRSYSSGSLTGTLAGPRAKSIKEVRGHVYMHDAATRADSDSLPQTTVSNASCSIAESVWRCAVPAEVSFDFRLDIPGFAAQYFWDVTVRPSAPFELEPQTLVAGSSIAGWVKDPKDTPIANARVSVALETAPSRQRERAAQMQTVRTNRRGFFQFTGLPPATYRIVSSAAKFSPAVVPQITTRGGEAVTLPRPIRHSPPIDLEVLIQPATDRSGGAWTVELTESAPLYPGKAPRVVSRRAGADGRWTASGLRADAYDLTIRDDRAGLVHRAQVDLFDGGPGTLTVSIAQIAVRGTVRAGDEPLRSDVRLWHRSGRTVEVSTDADGRFEVALPSAGTWEPTVLTGPGSAEVAAAPFEISEGTTTQEVVVQLAGGRIRGKALKADQKPGPTMVQAFRRTRRAAQQETGDDGSFDFVGLAPGTYRLDARSANAVTPHPVDVVIEEEESREVTLVMEPYARLSGHVVTPDGRAASGAVVKVSTDGGASWQRMVTDVHGRFERQVRGGTQIVQLVVLTYDYPAAMLARPLTDEPVRVQLRHDGGMVRFQSLAILMARGVSAPAHVFRFRSDGPFTGNIYLEAGAYTVCPVDGAQNQCRNLTITPSSQEDVDFTPKRPRESTGGTS